MAQVTDHSLQGLVKLHGKASARTAAGTAPVDVSDIAVGMAAIELNRVVGMVYI